MMKGNILLPVCLCLALLMASCKTPRVSQKKAMWKSIYVDQFKLTYLRAILSKGYNNSNAIQEIISLDNSGFTEPVLTDDDRKLIDSLTKAENEKMKADSTDGDRRAEGAQGKRPLQFIINTFDERSLEKLAKKRFKLSGLPEKN